jgi:hypothetical protein
MNVKASKSILTTTAALLFLATVAFAGFPRHSHSSTKSATIQVTDTTRVPDGPTLQPGTYKVTLLNGSGAPALGFYQQGSLVGQAPVKLVDQGKKIDQTEIQSNRENDGTGVMTELDLSGWTQKITFGQGGGNNNTGE